MFTHLQIFSHPVEGTLLIYCSDQTGVACTGVINRAWPLHRLRHSLYWGDQQVTPKCQDLSDIKMPQLPQVKRERSIGMLHAGMFSRSCCCTVQCTFLHHQPLATPFQLFGSTANRPHAYRPRVITRAQDRYIRLLHLRDRLWPATQTAQETLGLNNRRITGQTVLNRLREIELHARRPHQGLDLTGVRCRNRPQWANAHIRWTWHAGEESSGPMVDSVYGVVSVSA